MPRRRLVVVLAVVLAVAGVVAFLLLRGGGEEPKRVGDPLAEALSYAPASSDVVVAVDTDPGSQQRRALSDLVRTVPVARFAADQVEGELSRAGLKPDELRAILGGPVVVAGPQAVAAAALDVLQRLAPDPGPLLRAGATASVVGRSEHAVQDVLAGAETDGRIHAQGSVGATRLYALSGAVVARRGATLILARDADTLRRVLALHDRGGGMTRAAFEARLGPLRGPALVRAVARPRALLGPGARGVPWADALRDGALALRIEDPGLRLRLHLATDPAGLRPQDLPLALGPQPPRPAAGLSPAAAGVRDLSQTIAVLDRVRDSLRLPFIAPVTNALGDIDRYRTPLKILGVDVDEALFGQLTGTTTFTSERAGMAVRAELRDAGALRRALGRLANVPDIAIELTRITDLDIDEAGTDTYELRRNGRTFMRLAVLDHVLVASTDLTADLPAIARRRPVTATTRGALSGRLTGAYVQNLLVTRLGLPALARLVLGDIGDLTFSAQAQTTAVDAEAALALVR